MLCIDQLASVLLVNLFKFGTIAPFYVLLSFQSEIAYVCLCELLSIQLCRRHPTHRMLLLNQQQGALGQFCWLFFI